MRQSLPSLALKPASHNFRDTCVLRPCWGKSGVTLRRDEVISSAMCRRKNEAVQAASAFATPASGSMPELGPGLAQSTEWCDNLRVGRSAADMRAVVNASPQEA